MGTYYQGRCIRPPAFYRSTGSYLFIKRLATGAYSCYPAFTIGHSLTLALSVFDIIRFASNWVKFLIAVTIVLTAFSNCFKKNSPPTVCPYQLLFFGHLFWFDPWHGFR
jgi:hypothetical protein